MPPDDEAFVITAGAVYIYQAALPAGCAGHRYRAARFIVDVPSYQKKVLVECLSGRDAGLWFTCSLANFARRYRLAAKGA